MGSDLNMFVVRMLGVDRWNACRLLWVCGWWLVVVCLFCVLFPGCVFGLSGDRVYEMVTPVYKAGYSGVLATAAPDGESVAFTSEGGFSGLQFAGLGNQYVARRVAGSGWETQPLQPPFPGEIKVVDFSNSLLLALAGVHTGTGGFEYFLHDVETPDLLEYWYSFDGIALSQGNEGGSSGIELGASPDLCHVVVSGKRLLSEAPASGVQLYDLSRECGGVVGSLRWVNVRNGLGSGGGHRSIGGCQPFVGGRQGVGGSKFGAVSGDGREIFFTENVEQGVHPECSGGVYQVFVRLGGERTVEVSRPLSVKCQVEAGVPEDEVPCHGAGERASAEFAGASEDGSVVYFTTAAALVPGDVDGSDNLYMARIGCPGGVSGCEAGSREVTSLVRVSEDPSVGQAASVLGVVAVAPGSGVVYFVARGALTGVANNEGEIARDGADNLYVYDPQGGGLEFVADLCSGAASSGVVDDSYCPPGLAGGETDTGLWGGAGEAQVNENGDCLVFSTYARLVRRGPDTDTNTNRDVYRFDLGSGGLERVSTGEGGYDANGNGSGAGPGASIALGAYGGEGGTKVESESEMSTRAVSEDGSWIVFSSAESLSPYAINGKQDIYAWHETPGSDEGTVSLISSGTATSDDIDPVITPSGRDIFFTTAAGLVADDTDNEQDVYDARLGGGFPPVAVPVGLCSGEACASTLQTPVPLLTAGSASQAPGGNWPAPQAKKPAGGKHHKKKVEKRKLKGKPSVGKKKHGVKSKAGVKHGKSARRQLGGGVR